MILVALSVLVCCYACIYALFTFIISIGERRMKPCGLPETLPKVSVIVCARNEERNIRRCLDHLLALDYPRDRLEMIVVDDESEDGTLAILRQFEGRDESLKILSAAGESRILHAKQRPLNMGIRESSGDFILITDADIAVKPGWVKAHLAMYHPHIGIVGGTTRIDTSSGKFFDRIQNVELVSKHAVAMGCAGLRLPLTLMGNNFSFRRNAYDQVGGILGMNRSIVEDMALLNAVIRRTAYTQGWVADPEGTVVSLPEKNFTTFINQRLRWVHELTDLSGIGKVLISMEMGMFIAFFVSIALLPWTATPFLCTAALWMAGYVLILFPSPGREKGDLIRIPATLIFQMMYSVVFGFRMLFGSKKIVWKGREFD